MSIAGLATYQNRSMYYSVRNGAGNYDFGNGDSIMNQMLALHKEESGLVQTEDGNNTSIDSDISSELRFGSIQGISPVGAYGESKPYTRCITASIKTKEMLAHDSDGQTVFSYQEEEKSFSIYINSDGKDKTYTIKGIDENGQEIEEEFDPYNFDPEMMDFPEFSALCMYIRQTDETADLMSKMVFTDTSYFNSIFEKGDRVPLLKDYAEEYREVTPSLAELASMLFDAINEFFEKTAWNNNPSADRLSLLFEDRDDYTKQEKAITDVSAMSKQSDIDTETLGKATSRTTSSNNGKFIGLMTVGNTGYTAKYADSSTDQEPVIKVGDYEVRVNDVDPENATELEMFALMSYLDDKGLTNNHGMKSFNKMRAYSRQAEYNGFCTGIADPEAFWTKRRDWISVIQNAGDTYDKIPNAYKQSQDCQRMIASMDGWKMQQRKIKKRS